ncbi:unnamed protein product [Caenorhabditis bovis]|uniref:Uncharacterized protein n=1 Tax=Caenorhabditis bovis TaxID=2654633 RepID=A0A8S1EUH7_9PELO|nr:unnamed protein product [Caenorhabditis bovis]
MVLQTSNPGLQPPRVMEHENQKMNSFTGLMKNSNESSSNGDLLNESRILDDEAEIEAAAAESETGIPISIPEPDSLKPLHVQVNGFSNPGSGASTSIGSRPPSSDLNFSADMSPMQQQRLRNPLPSPLVRETNFRPPKPVSIVMGPPSSSSQVLLSPAGNLNNGFQRNSGESSPRSPSFFPNRSRREAVIPHPLATSSSSSGPSISARPPLPQPPHRMMPLTSGGNSGVPHTSTTLGASRKEIDMSKRRMMTEKIHKLRQGNVLHGFLTATDTLTDTQLALQMRRNKNDVVNVLPRPVFNEAFDEKTEEPDTAAILGKKVRELRVRYTRDNDPSELTDLSDEDGEPTLSSKARRNALVPVKMSLSGVRWAEQKLRFGVQLAKSDALLDETIEAHCKLNEQLRLVNASSGCRFADEPSPRKRRRIDGSFVLFQNCDFERKPDGNGEFGCARARPLFSWTRRKLLRNVFDEEKDNLIFDPNRPGCSTNSEEKLPKYDDRNIPIGANKVVTTLTETKEKREITEYDYISYEEGRGAVEVKKSFDDNVVEYIAPKEFRPFEARMRSLHFRMASVPSMSIRKHAETSILMNSCQEERARNGVERQISVKERRDGKERRKERKMELDTSDDDEWIQKNGSRRSSKSKKKGRPAKSAKKTNKPTTRSTTGSLKHKADIDDYYLEEPYNAPLPPKMKYARILVPTWETVPSDYWTNLKPSSRANSPVDGEDDLRATVGVDHYKLAFLEKERVKRDTARKNRANKSAPLKAGASTPAQSSSTYQRDDLNWNFEEILKDLPPYDEKKVYENRAEASIRRFASIERPYLKRTFPLDSNNS